MKRVLHAKLQNTDAHVPGIGSLGSTLPAKKTFDRFDMFDVGDKLLVLIRQKGVDYRVFIPMMNVQIGLYAPEESENKS